MVHTHHPGDISLPQIPERKGQGGIPVSVQHSPWHNISLYYLTGWLHTTWKSARLLTTLDQTVLVAKDNDVIDFCEKLLQNYDEERNYQWSRINRDIYRSWDHYAAHLHILGDMYPSKLLRQTKKKTFSNQRKPTHTTICGFIFAAYPISGQFPGCTLERK